MFVSLKNDGRLCLLFMVSFFFHSMFTSCDQRVLQRILVYFLFLFSFRLKPAYYSSVCMSMYTYIHCDVYLCMHVTYFWYENSKKGKNDVSYDCPWLEVIHMIHHFVRYTHTHSFVEYKQNSIVSFSEMFLFCLSL